MSTNKNALIRYKVLDNCFRNSGRRYFINDLISECENVLFEIDPKTNGISRRQILADIAFMESKEGWEIELIRNRDGKKVYYHYAESSFSINNMPLNETEINQLKTAVNILSQFKGMPQFEWINELIPKLKQGMSSTDASPVIMEFDSNQDLKGIEHLGTLYNAVFYRKVLVVSYQPFGNELPYDVIIHPYFLKQYNNRWFLFGFNPEKNKHDWNIAIDRIVSIKEINSEFHPNTFIIWNDYFEEIIGVTKPEKAAEENIVLHFYGKTGKYILTKPLHGSQKSSWLDENTLEVRLDLIINYELERLILSYADSAKVILPLTLAEAVRNRLENALKHY